MQRVVSIDDMNGIAAPVEDALALAQTLDPGDITEIFGGYPVVIATPDLEIRLSEIRKLWGTENEEPRRSLLNRLRVRKAESDKGNSEQALIDVVEYTFLELPSLFGKYGLELMSLKQWREKKGDYMWDDASYSSHGR